MLTAPEGFGCIEEGLYRCSSIENANHQFLFALGLKTIISLNPDKPPKPVRHFAADAQVTLSHLGKRSWRKSADWMVMDRDLLQSAFSHVLDKRNHPVLVLDSSCTFSCLLRRLQKWSYASVVAEYHSFTPKAHYMTEIFLEIIDIEAISEDDVQSVKPNDKERPSNLQAIRDKERKVVIILPPDEVLPQWMIRQKQIWNEELKTELGMNVCRNLGEAP